LQADEGQFLAENRKRDAIIASNFGPFFLAY
jgi:hypothetical protein